MELAQKIRDGGPIRFDLFMQSALYHPQHGFYTSGHTRTGVRGDFLTPVSAGPVLGQLLARQVDEWHAASGRPSPICLIEQGADRGLLAADILDGITAHHPELPKATQLHLIEPSPALAEQQKTTLRSHKGMIPIQWHQDVESFSPIRLLVFFTPVNWSTAFQSDWLAIAKGFGRSFMSPARVNSFNGKSSLLPPIS